MAEIWIINHYAVTPDVPAASRHYDLGSELSKKNIRVKVFACDYRVGLKQNIRLRKGELYKKEAVNNVDFVWIWADPYERNNWRRVWNMVSFARNAYKTGVQLREKPDFIIGSSPHLFAALAGYFLAKKNRARFFLEIRDLWPLFLIEIGGMSKYNPLMVLFRLIEKYLYKKADRIIVLAPGSTGYLQENGVNPNKVVFIPNGVHLGHFQVIGDKDALRESYGFKKFTIVYAGAHGPANALHTILNAAALLRDNDGVEFLLVGDGVMKDQLVDKARSLDLENVRFMEPVARTEIPRVLKAADAGVITLKNVPSFAFGVSPNKFFDYMASSLPIIAAVGGEINRIVSDNELGAAVPPEDHARLAEAVKYLCNLDSKERKNMGQRGRKLVEQKFSREKLADDLAELVQG